jgi:hypothetical protein
MSNDTHQNNGRSKLAQDLGVTESDARFIVNECREANKRCWHVEEDDDGDDQWFWLIAPNGRVTLFNRDRAFVERLARKMNRLDAIVGRRKPAPVYPPVDDERFDGVEADTQREPTQFMQGHG